MRREVRTERTGWRDLALNDRHRLWGWDCPAVDIDWLFLEYDTGKAIALVEYKHENAAPQKASHPSYQAMIDIGDRADLPVFVVRYGADFTWWRVIPLNAHARKWVQGRQDMSEREYLSLLYRMRGREAPESDMEL